MSDIPILELLSPAKNKEVALQALNAGADAVYIGGPAFGAREAAGNAWSDIEAVAAYSHRYGAKTYLTLNTILFEDELEAARKAALTAYEAGVDALIVQDMAFLKMDLPPIELHASTQCDIRTPEKVRFLADVGFSQVVLARELTLEQIRACRAAAPNATLEFFVHGALCVCVTRGSVTYRRQRAAVRPIAGRVRNFVVCPIRSKTTRATSSRVIASP